MSSRGRHGMGEGSESGNQPRVVSALTCDHGIGVYAVPTARTTSLHASVAPTPASDDFLQAHYNPAVTIAHVLQGSLPGLDGLVYIATQLVAATIGAFLGGAFYGFPAGTNNVDMAALPAGANAVDDPASTEFIMGTAIGSLTLCLVHLHVLSTQPGNGFFGLAVGATL